MKKVLAMCLAMLLWGGCEVLASSLTSGESTKTAAACQLRTGLPPPEPAYTVPSNREDLRNLIVLTAGGELHLYTRSAGRWHENLCLPQVTTSGLPPVTGVATGRLQGAVAEGAERLLLVFLCDDTDRQQARCAGRVVNVALPDRERLHLVLERLSTNGLRRTLVLIEAPAGPVPSRR